VFRRNETEARTRVVTVQGPGQLLSVLAVLRYQQEEEALTGFNDILVIGDLHSIRSARAGLYAACMEIQKVWKFSSVIDLTQIQDDFKSSLSALLVSKILQRLPKWIQALNVLNGVWRIGRLLERLLKRLVRLHQRSLFRYAIERLQTAVGSSCVEYVYTLRNTQFLNEVALSAFPQASRICYGDGLGYLVLNKSYGAPTYNPHGFLPMHRACLIAPVEGEPGHLDLLPIDIVPHRYYVDTLHAVVAAYDTLRERAAYFSAMSGGLPITVVLTSYLTEYRAVASAQEEVRLYVSLVLPHITRQEFVLIKGHPREAYGQSELFAQNLREAGFRCAVMTGVSHLPIELFAPLLPIQKVVNFGSTGFLGILMVRHCPVVLGLGAKAYRDTLRFDDELGAFHWERLMILLAQQAYAGKFSPIRLTDEQYMRTKLPDYPTLISPTLTEEMTHPL
jgi:hypothetical protein